MEDRSAMDGHPKRAKRVDKGKVMALHEGTVCRVLKEMKEENREKD